MIGAVLAACSTTRPASAPPDNSLPTGDQGGHEKVGNPYKIAGRWYTPKREPSYDVVGLASWYGKQFHGKKTANGEVFNMNALTAAHKTLPMPSFVKVTNLSNGRSLVLRVNDRGPFVDDRIIDVSRRAAQILGFENKGVTRVRVQISDKNGRVPDPRRVDRVQAQPPKAQTPGPQTGLPPNTGAGSDLSGDQGNHYVQLGAFSRRQNAENQALLATRAGSKADLEKIDGNGQSLWRVRVGPFIRLEDARQALGRLRAQGFEQARIFSPVQ